MKKVKSFIGSSWGQRVVLLVLIFIIMFFGEKKFFTGANWSSILLAISLYGIMACGMLFVVLTGGIDLSVGSMGACAGCYFAFTWVNSDYTAEGLLSGILFALMSGIIVGLINGVLVAYFKQPAFVVTLATQYLVYGFTIWYTQGSFVYPVRQLEKGMDLFYAVGNAKFLGLTMPVWVFFAIIIMSAFVLTKTTFGRRIYAVGGSQVAARLVGIDTKIYTVAAFVISAVFASIAGMVLVSLNMVAGCNTASGYEGNVLMAMVVGGINLAGGEGGIAGVVFGAVFVGIINNALILLGIPSDYNTFVQGAVIIAAICLNVETSRRAAGIMSPRRLKKIAERSIDLAK